MAEFKTVRIVVNNSSAVGHNLDFFIITGSDETPIACLGDNNGYPSVRDFYARQHVYQTHKGVHVTINLEGPASGNEFAINIAQPGMSGDFTVIPL